MKYIDIHTHTQSSVPDVFALYSPLEIKTQDWQKYNFTIGLHPWNLENWQEIWPIVHQNANLPTVWALGETGFDRLRGGSLMLQAQLFRMHQHLSEQVSKPLIIHCVRSSDVLLQHYTSARPTQAWIHHGFRGKPQLAEQLTRKGIYLSLGAAVQNMAWTKEILKICSYEKIFLETDEDNFSIAQIYAWFSEASGLKMNEIMEICAQNFQRVFQKEIL